MRYWELLEGRQTGSLEVAVDHIRDGFQHGTGRSRYSCYSHVGHWLRELDDATRQQAEMRLWGTNSGRIYHADLVVPHAGSTAEVKSYPVSPDQYPPQFVVIRTLHPSQIGLS